MSHATASYQRETTASPTQIWAYFSDVAHWHTWNAGVATCTLHGPFEAGSWMTMVLPDHTRLDSQLVEVNAPYSFTDETVLGDVRVRVHHEVRPLGSDAHAIVYSIEVQGADAQLICDQVSADFADVLEALVARLAG